MQFGTSAPSARAHPLRYGTVPLSTGLATGLWLYFGQQLLPSPFLLFTAAVALCAWWGGLGPALVAIAVSILACLLLYYLPFDPQDFSPAQAAAHLLLFLLLTLLIATLQVGRQRAQRALAYQALHDPLTSLPNRRLFFDRLQQLLVSAQRTGRCFALVLLDLDGFKRANDSLGHLRGDLLLTQLAHRLRAHARASDTVARLGGDEFALLLPETDEQGALAMISKLQELLREPVVLEDGVAVSVGASMGLALYPHHGSTEESLLDRADSTMYASKRGQGLSNASGEAAILTSRAATAAAGAEVRPDQPPEHEGRGCLYTGPNARRRPTD